ncbi:hypothetical protein [Nostoc phage Nsp-JY21]
MPRTAPLSPDALAQARATIDVTAASDPDISEIRNAWAYLKSQRGQHVRPALLAPAHIMTPPAQAEPGTEGGLVSQLDAARARTSQKVRESMALREIRAARSQPDLGGAA